MNKLLTVLLLSIFLFSFSSAFNWNDNTVVSYHKLDETSGTFNDVLNLYNLTNSGVTYGSANNGIINNAPYSTATGDVLDSSSSPSIINNFSISLWAYRTATGAQYGDVLFEVGKQGDNNGFGIWISGSLNADGPNEVAWRIGSDYIHFYDNLSLTLNTWEHIVMTYDGENVKMYKDGDLIITDLNSVDPVSVTNYMAMFSRPSLTETYIGRLDEVGLWNISLSAEDITELYNSGSGLEYGSSSGFNIKLVSPSNDTTVSDIGANFSVTGTVDNTYNFTNATFTIWNSDSTIHNETTIISLGNQTFNETLFIDNFILGDYIWNVYACADNATDSTCKWATENRTLSVVPFSLLADTYNTITIEGSTDLFTANLSFLSGQRLSEIKFNYNGTIYDATSVEYSTGLYFVSYYNSAPLVSTDTNISFFWNITLETGLSATTQVKNQTVLDYSIDDCSVNSNVLFNFTMVDEDNQLFLDGVGEETSTKADITFSRLDGTQLPINFSQNYTQINPAVICGSNAISNSTFRVDGVIEYESLDRFIEFYNIQNYILTNATDNQNITLYNLDNSTGQEFKITYKDQNFNTLPGALIQIQRKYIDEGIFKTIEIPRISSAGYTMAHLIRNDVIYNLVVTNEGVVIDTFIDIVANCQNPSFTDCEININSFASTVEPEVFSNYGSISATLSYNRTTRTISSIFVIPSGVPATASLDAYVFDGYNNISVCSDSLMASGGTLSCTVPLTFGNQTVVVDFKIDGVIKRQSMISLSEDPNSIYGNSLVFIGLSLLLLLIGIGITDNPMFLGFMMIVGVVLLITFNIIYSLGLVGGGATILWLVVAIVLLIIKGSNRQ